MKDIARILHYLRPFRRLVVVSGALVVFGAFATLLTPWPLKLLFDNVLGGHPLPTAIARVLGPIADSRVHLLVIVVVASVAVAVLHNALAVLDSYVNSRIEQSMILDMRSDLFRHALKLPLSYYDQSRAGMLIYGINNEAAAAAQLVSQIPPLLQSLMTLVGVVWITFRIEWHLALLSLVIVPLLYYSVTHYVKRIQPRLLAVKMLEGESLSIIHETISMLRVIIAFVRERYEYGRFRTQGEAAIRARITLTVRQTLFSLVVNTTTALGVALVLGFGAYYVLKQRMTPGDLLVVMTYVAAMYSPLETISNTIGSAQDQLVSLRVAFRIQDTEPDIQDLPGAAPLDRCVGDVTFEDVAFRHQGRAHTLRGVSFAATAGQVVAIVGPTGAGKTTLVNLLPRFYDAQNGRILLDGRDIRTLTLASLRQHVSVVHQEPMLFSASIADNIRYGRLDATMEEIEAAAIAAHAHEFIMALPRRYETVLGERGAQVSGGERQRIAIARAFLKDAPVLILDEPTSAIDSRTESIILDALERLMIGRTTFMVAHRLSTIRHADQILVLNDGQIVERGTHDELIASGNLYPQLYESQVRRVRRKAGRRTEGDAADMDSPDAAGATPMADDIPRAETPPAVPAAPPPLADRPMPAPALPRAATVAARPKIVLLGMMSKIPVPGVIWQTLHYLIGFERLGYDAYYVEAHARTPSMLMEREDDDGAARAAAFIDGVMRRFDLGGRWAFQALHADGRCFGMSEAALMDLYRSASAVINLHGGTEPRPEHYATDRLVYLETDPVLLQFELRDNLQQSIDFLAPHCAFFTFAENLGNADCGLPVSPRFRFRPTRQPVVTDLWRPFQGGPATTFTTVGNWQQPWRDVAIEGEVYRWSKHHEFLKFLTLPQRARQSFELALSSYTDDDKRLLEAHDWKVRHALDFGLDLDAYRAYIATSRGEFTVAKDQNIRLRSGWFSDRSATYLAAGRPVIMQETGFSNILPTGRGLFAFSTMEEIEMALDTINATYDDQCAAAEEIAREYFDSGVVLSQMLRDIGMATTQRRSRAPEEAVAASTSPPDPPIVDSDGGIPASLALHAESRWPVRMPDATVALALALPIPATLPPVDRAIGGGVPRASIVVVAFNNLPLTKLCLTSLLANTTYPAYDIIVVDNGSTDGTDAYLRALVHQHTHLRVVTNETNQGFARANNRALALVTGDIVVLLNNDTVVPPGWLAALVHHLDDPSVGMVGPVTNWAGNEARITVPYKTYGAFIRFARERAEGCRHLQTAIPMLTMFCVAMRRSVRREIGALDERYEIGMFEDDDYAMRMQAAGYRIVCAEDVVVHHVGQASIGQWSATDDYGALFHRNRRKFEEKWGRDWHPHARREDRTYADLVAQIHDVVRATLPPNTTVAVISKGDDALIGFGGQRGRHFPCGSDGGYAGHYPADSDAAIEHLEEQRARGAAFFLVPSSASWWLEYYEGFATHLARRYPVVADEPGVCRIYGLTDAAGAESHALATSGDATTGRDAAGGTPR